MLWTVWSVMNISVKYLKLFWFLFYICFEYFWNSTHCTQQFLCGVGRHRRRYPGLELKLWTYLEKVFSESFILKSDFIDALLFYGTEWFAIVPYYQFEWVDWVLYEHIVKLAKLLHEYQYVDWCNFRL